MATLAGGGTDEAAFAAILGSAEYAHDTGSGFIVALYQSLLHRPPDPAGLAQWTARGLGHAQLVTTILASAEYRARVVADAYTHFLGRQVDPVGLADWTARLGAGLTDEQFLVGIFTSAEFTTAHP